MKSLFRIGVAAGVASFGLVLSASAADMSGVFGNTVNVSGPQGEIKMYIDSDGTFSQHFANGVVAKGTWADSDGQLCFTATDPTPPAGTKPNCVPSAAHKAGDTWSVTDTAGNTSTVSIVAGRS